MRTRAYRILTVIVSFISLLLSVCTSVHAARPRPEVIQLYGDAQSLAAAIFPIKDRFEKETGVKIVTITEATPLSSVQDLDTGACDALVTAMSFEELNELADKAGIQRKNRALTQHVVLFADIDYRIIVHPRNPVAALTDKQLRKIFSGSYDNWDDVDGPDLPLSVVWGTGSTGSPWILADRIMEGEAVLPNVTPASNATEMVAAVAASQNAVAIVPQAALTGGVKPVQTSELKIKGPIILVSVGFPQPPLLKLIKFLRDNSQRDIGF